MPLTKIPLSALTKRGVGLKRPEDVVVSRDGHVWASDEASACAEILPDGGLRRVGKAGGRPNGINMDRQGRILIANFALDTSDPGGLQRLDPRTGTIEMLCAEVDGRALKASNYPLVDRAGNVWCSHSTWDRAGSAAGSGDGFVYRVSPDGRAQLMAEGFHFTNGLAMDPDESHLYVCQTMGNDVVRLPIRRDGTPGAGGALRALARRARHPRSHRRAARHLRRHRRLRLRPGGQSLGDAGDGQQGHRHHARGAGRGHHPRSHRRADGLADQCQLGRVRSCAISTSAACERTTCSTRGARWRAPRSRISSKTPPAAPRACPAAPPRRRPAPRRCR